MKTPKYRNKFEEKVGEVLGARCGYEKTKVPYTVHRNYLPDFTYKTDKKTIYFEAKGFFRVGDTQKYKAIRDCMGPTEEIVFILYNPRKQLRKGSKMSMSEWCDKEGIRWFTVDTCKDAFKEPKAK